MYDKKKHILIAGNHVGFPTLSRHWCLNIFVSEPEWLLSALLPNDGINRHALASQEWRHITEFGSIHVARSVWLAQVQLATAR